MTAKAGATTPRVAAIQQLRAVAVLLVIAVHAINAAGNHYHHAAPLFGGLPNLPLFGNAGVDLFFVISGFAMAHSLARPTSAPAFLLARWRRIWPLYVIATAAALVLPSTWPRVSATAVISSVCLLPVTDMSGYHQPLLVVGWTLGFEMMFYLLTALVITQRRGAWLLLCLAAVAALIGTSVTPGWAPARMLLNPLTGEFALGVAVWIAWSRGVPEAVALGAFTLGVALIVAGVTGLIPITVGTEPWLAVAGISSVARLVVWGGPWALIVLGLAAGTPSNGWLATMLGRIGDASYAIYLFHLTAIGIFALVAPDVIAQPAFIAAAAGIGLSSGIIAHHTIERPLLRILSGSRRRITPRPAHRMPAH